MTVVGECIPDVIFPTYQVALGILDLKEWKTHSKQKQIEDKQKIEQLGKYFKNSFVFVLLDASSLQLFQQLQLSLSKSKPGIIPLFKEVHDLAEEMIDFVEKFGSAKTTLIQRTIEEEETIQMLAPQVPFRIMMSVPGLSRNDCTELLQKFGSLRNVILAQPQSVSATMGWTQERANKFCSFFENDYTTNPE